MKMTTEEAFVKTLQMHGIEHAFGIIGSAFMPISDLFPKAGITFWDGSLWMAALRGQTLWEVPLDEDVAGDPVPHLAGEHGRLRNVVVATGGNALWVATSNTDGRGEPASDDDRVLTLTR